MFTLYGHTGEVTSVSFSPDGTRIVTGSQDTTAKVWDARDRRTPARAERAQERGHQRRVQPGRHPNRHRLSRQYGEGVGLRDRHSPGRAERPHGRVWSVAFSPDGTRIVTGSDDRTAKLWDARTGTSLLELNGHTGMLWGVSFSPDGTRIVTGSSDRTARVWDARSGHPCSS